MPGHYIMPMKKWYGADIRDSDDQAFSYNSGKFSNYCFIIIYVFKDFIADAALKGVVGIWQRNLAVIECNVWCCIFNKGINYRLSFDLYPKGFKTFCPEYLNQCATTTSKINNRTYQEF